MKKRIVKFTPFDAADYLDDEEVIAEYLKAAKEDPNPEVVQVALRDVARARERIQRKQDSNENKSAK